MGPRTAGTGNGRRCELTVSGQVARSVVAAMRARFDVVSTRTADDTVLTVGVADQAAVRALLIILWDAGHEVVAMTTEPTEPVTGHRTPSPGRWETRSRR